MTKKSENPAKKDTPSKGTGVNRRDFIKGLGALAILTGIGFTGKKVLDFIEDTSREPEYNGVKRITEYLLSESDSNNARKIAEYLLSKKLNEFNKTPEALNQLFHLMNGLEFEEVEKDDLNGKTFSVELVKKKPQKFKQGRIDDLEYIEKPVFGMRIKISRDFQMSDQPAFNNALKEIHNQWLEANGYTKEKNPEYFLDENQNLARFWHFFAGKLENLLKQNETEEKYEEKHHNTKLIETQLGVFAQVLRNIGNIYGKEDELNPQTTDNHLEFLWTKHLRDQIKRILKKSREKNPEVIKRATKILSKRGQKNIESKLDTQFRQGLFRHAEKEMWRKSDISPVVKDNYGRRWWQIFEKLGLVKEKQRLKDHQDKYRKLQEEIKKSTTERGTAWDFSEKKLQKELAELQIKIAKDFNRIIFNEEFWEYKEDKYSFEDLLEKEVNCMTRGELIASMWREFFGEEVLGATIPGHYFTILPLADGRYISIGSWINETEGLGIINNLEEWQKENFVQIGLHEDFYQAGVLSWKVDELTKNKKTWKLAEILCREAIRLSPLDPNHKNNLANLLAEQPSRWTEAEELYREAIRLNPEDSDYKNNLASLLSKQPDRWTEAEELYREAIYLNPEDPSYKHDLANLLVKQPSRWEEAEELYLKAEGLAKEDPWFATSLANFYDRYWVYKLSKEEEKKFNKQYPNRREEALKWYKKAVEVMKENPGKPNWLTLKQIEKRIAELEKLVKN